ARAGTKVAHVAPSAPQHGSARAGDDPEPRSSPALEGQEGLAAANGRRVRGVLSAWAARLDPSPHNRAGGGARARRGEYKAKSRGVAKEQLQSAFLGDIAEKANRLPVPSPCEGRRFLRGDPDQNLQGWLVARGLARFSLLSGVRKERLRSGTGALQMRVPFRALCCANNRGCTCTRLPDAGHGFSLPCRACPGTMETMQELIPFAKEMLSQKPNGKMVKMYMLGSVLAVCGVVIGLVETVCSPFTSEGRLEEEGEEEEEKKKKPVAPLTKEEVVPQKPEEVALEKSKPSQAARNLVNRAHAS
ncbi:hypothetical protein lerEdw1_001755, partial [Lerista edwardsae]